MTTADEALRQAQEQADRDAALEDQQVLAEAAAQGDRIGELERKIDQLQHSHVDGALIERMYISDGEGGVRGVIGGASGIVVRDTNQPTPTAPILEEVSELGVVEVRWDGEVTSDHPIPRGSAFGRVQTRHRLIEGGVQPDPDGPDWKEGGAIGTFTGGTTTVALGQPGTHAIWFYMTGPNGFEKSEYSQPLIVEVEPLVDRDEIQQWIDEKAEELEKTIHNYGNREGTEPPTEDAPEGVVYYQKDDQGQVMGIWQSQGEGNWVGLPLNSEVLASVTTDKLVAGESLIDGVLIKDGAITLDKITVTEELVAELARFLTVEADNIAANAIDGMTITGAELIGGLVRGGYLQIGDRYVGGSTNQGTEITTTGVLRHYDQSGNVDVEINGSNNRFGGRFTTMGSSGSAVEIDTNFSSMAGIRLNTGSSADSEPTLLAINQSNYWYGSGSTVLSGRQTVMNQSNRADLVLRPNGNWSLQRGDGDAIGIGVHQNAWELHLRGRSENHYLSQFVGGVSSTFNMSGYVVGMIWAMYPAPVPNGTRVLLHTPSYRHSSTYHRAKVGISTVSSSSALMILGDTSGGATWRTHWLARWE